MTAVRLPSGSRAVVVAVVSVALAAAAAAAIVQATAGDRARSAAASSTGECLRRPYDRASPWNRLIGSRPRVDPRSARFIRAIADNGKPLTSDPDQYTPAVYAVRDGTPLRTVTLSGYYSTYDAGDDSRKGHGFARTIPRIPIPDRAVAPPGDDGQVVLWNASTGVEHAFWQFARDASGNYTATNGYRYHTKAGYHGRFADGLAGRGAGLPYLGGLVRRCEIGRGAIHHALAFAYDAPSRTFVYPASKSDGEGSDGELPEGSRLQLDPALGEAAFDAWRLPLKARTIALALQRYGMYVVDNSGSSKIFLEARQTAGWDRAIGPDLVSGIPWKAFRVVQPPPGGRSRDRGSRSVTQRSER
ncbi:MAG: hypothetical protein QOF69_2392 [Solirubrobacteraceae bacterium]|nr:hypothetical protein [Solirubrobacteraceae bacterium]